MKQKMIELIKKELSNSDKININNIQKQLCEITGRNVKCSQENHELVIKISVPWIGKSMAEKMLNPDEIQKLLNNSNLNCSFNCLKYPKGGLGININNSPKPDINKITINIV